MVELYIFKIFYQGPVKAPTNIRATTVVDYVQELCRDFKETGYCTFGDSCKFIHDRGDYKSGWELVLFYLFIQDKEWEEQQEKKRKALENGEVFNQEDEDKKYEIDTSDEDELPTECPICGNEFINPIMTLCHHYFCLDCALKRFKKSKTCATCGKLTNGSFNTAKDIINSLKKKREADEREKENENKLIKNDSDDERNSD